MKVVNPFAYIAAWIRFFYANVIARYRLKYMRLKNGLEASDVKTVASLLGICGFVVVKMREGEVDCRGGVEEMWEEMEERLRGRYLLQRDLDRKDMSTWGVFEAEMVESGLHSKNPTVGPVAFKHRLLPSLYSIFSSLLKTKDLFVSIDRYGILRPGGYNPQYLTSPDWLHWDTNPQHPATQQPACLYELKRDLPVELHDIRRATLPTPTYQALLNLTESDTEGGFQCIPGVHHILPYLTLPPTDHPFVFFPKDHWIKRFLLKVPAEKATLIIWNNLLPHSNYQNTTEDKIRCVQYITMFPKECISPENQVKRKALLLKTLKGSRPPRDVNDLLGLA
eukprot:TRINITY_DN5012_c0_g2_i1.p1 TRINITY_DN5012_c0_g2~~TRINITY_DN5012_c0_g2_i1.p1  ORF type:complete len:337 (+),score=71.83 TRINITY_DN5012_c0_g2_i1:67-1077(+)